MKKLLLSASLLALCPTLAAADGDSIYMKKDSYTYGDANMYYFAVNGQIGLGSTGKIRLLDDDLPASGRTDYEMDYGLGLAYGYHPMDNLRLEVGLDYRHMDDGAKNVGGTIVTKSLDSGMLDLMFNIYLDMFEGEMWSPYVGVGVGLAHEFEFSHNALAYQFMAGMNYKVAPEGEIYAGYKYFAAGDFKSSFNDANLGIVKTKSRARDHILEIGYRYHF